jgi:ribosomal-protein-alanine N-acetyltransferase
MKIFETERLLVRSLKASDVDAYFDMMGNSKVMRLIPREVMTKPESDAHLNRFLEMDYSQSDTKVWAIESKQDKEFIGICAFLKNSDNDDEIGYRLREKFWKQGFGTEIAKGLISFGFQEMNMKKITADVDTKNLNSVRILDKFMESTKEFFNDSDNCTDRRYEVLKTDW